MTSRAELRRARRFAAEVRSLAAARDGLRQMGIDPDRIITELVESPPMVRHRELVLAWTISAATAAGAMFSCMIATGALLRLLTASTEHHGLITAGVVVTAVCTLIWLGLAVFLGRRAAATYYRTQDGETSA